MPSAPRLLVFAGSARAGSHNKRLARAALAVAEAQGAAASFADLAEFPMPIYDGDLESRSGMPAEAQRFRELLIAHDAFLIASPEYNSSFSPLLKNAIDWASRSQPSDSSPVPAFKGKVAGIMAASPGRLGGIRMLPHLRQVLTTLGTLVVPEQLALAQASEAFAEDGSLKDAANQKMLEGIVANVIRLARLAAA